MLPGWVWLRHGAGARLGPFVALDAAPLLVLWLAVTAATSRPVLAGAAAAGICVFLDVADRAKRAALAEPLAFTDGGLLWQVVAHPKFYLPAVGRKMVAGGTTAVTLSLVALVALERPLALSPAMRGLLAVAAMALAAILWRPLWLLPADLARTPEADSAAYGPLATFALHARLAAVERDARRAAYPPAPAIFASGAAQPHLLLLQLESFCDPRGLDPEAPAGLLPHWDALSAEAMVRGWLTVPGFGANTMRTEFGVLSGLGDAALGLDALNPYFRFARKPVASLAWALRGAGYATSCLHPYDPRFFGRDRVMPALGFAHFGAEAEFRDSPREEGLVTDAALGQRLAWELRDATAPTFLCAITVAAHGPWRGEDPTAVWRARMAKTDAMLGLVAEAARSCGRPVVLAAFGDHRPALPFARGGVETDHLVWRSDAPGTGTASNLDATGLHRAIRAAMRMG
ncbi:MAG: sulfatase [Rubritepida sp.]|nr:sulfatase [Rubritepida sp.]